MSDVHKKHNAGDRDPSRSMYETAKARRILADLFVKKWLVPSKRSVQLEWVKVVAECVMGADLYGPNGRAWIAQADVEAALIAAGYRMRRSKVDRHVYIGCALHGQTLKQHRFFKRGGRW